MKTLTILGAVLLFTLNSIAQPGELFDDFGNNGVIERQVVQGVDHEIQAVIELSDQSIVTVGSIFNNEYNSLMSRYTKDGQLLWDVEFDASSQNLQDFTEAAVAKDSCIFTASFYQDDSFPNDSRSSVRLRKWNFDGTRNSDFGTAGEVTVTNANFDFLIFDMQMDTSDRFYLIGRTFDFGSNQEAGLVIRLNPDGSMDNTYATNGIYTKRWNFNRTGLIRGKIINEELYLVGWTNNSTQTDLNAVFMKVDEAGETDTNFGNNGLVTFTTSNVAEFWSLDQQGEDHIIITGSFGNGDEDIIVRRYDLGGVIDNNFGSNGTVIVDLGDDDDVKSLLVDRDQGIYIGAAVNSPEDFGLIRLTPDGALDPDFGNNGVATFDVTDEDNLSEMVLLRDGNMVLGGESDADNDSHLLVMKVQGTNGCLPVSTDISLTECDSLAWNNEILTVSGSYQQVFTTSSGCDSTVNLTLTIDESNTETLSIQACESYILNGMQYTTSGAYTQTLTNQVGCDSVLNLELSILEPSVETMMLNSCDEQVTINSETYSTSGTYEQVLTNANGCDSVLTIELNIWEATAETLMLNSCDAQVTINSETYSTSGTYEQVLTNANGCDSVLTIELNILEATAGSITVNSCGEPVTVNGETYMMSGSYEQILTNANGCDSILTIEANIQMLEATIVNVDNTLSTSVAADGYQWIDCASNEAIVGETSNAFTPVVSGEYAVVITVGECTDTSSCEIITLTAINDISALGLSIAPNPAVDEIVLHNPQHHDIIEVSIFNSQGSSVLVHRNMGKSTHIRTDISGLRPGLYYVYFFKRNGRKGYQPFVKM